MGCISVSEVVRAKGQGQSLDLWIIEGRDWRWVITSLSVIYEWAKLQLLDASVSWHEKSTMLLWELLPCLFIFWLFGLKIFSFFPKVSLPLDLWTTLFNAAQFFPLMQMCVNHEQAPFPSSLGELGTLQGEQLVWAQGRLGIGAGNSSEVVLGVGGCAQSWCEVKSDLPPPHLGIPVPGSSSCACSASHPLTCYSSFGALPLFKLYLPSSSYQRQQKYKYWIILVSIQSGLRGTPYSSAVPALLCLFWALPRDAAATCLGKGAEISLLLLGAPRFGSQSYTRMQQGERGVASGKGEHCVGRCSFIFKLAELCTCDRWLSPAASFGKGTLKYSRVSRKGW